MRIKCDSIGTGLVLSVVRMTCVLTEKEHGSNYSVFLCACSSDPLATGEATGVSPAPLFSVDRLNPARKPHVSWYSL
jgi:hypothetical protein